MVPSHAQWWKCNIKDRAFRFTEKNKFSVDSTEMQDSWVLFKSLLLF